MSGEGQELLQGAEREQAGQLSTHREVHQRPEDCEEKQRAASLDGSEVGSRDEQSMVEAPSAATSDAGLPEGNQQEHAQDHGGLPKEAASHGGEAVAEIQPSGPSQPEAGVQSDPSPSGQAGRCHQDGQEDK